MRPNDGNDEALASKPSDGSDARSATARQRRRREILAAAKRVFADRGYHNASINDIIRGAKIARGTFYLYFQSKHLVFDSILDEAIRDLRVRIKRVDVEEGAPAPRVQLRGSLVRVLDYLIDDRHFTHMLLHQGLSTDAEVAERVNEFYGHVTDLIQSSLEHGIAMGLVRDCDTQLVAAALLGAIRGIISYLLTSSEELSQADREAAVDQLIAFALRGVVVGGRWESM